MNYQETIDYLFSALPIFQREGKTAFKKDLTNILLLCDALGNPHKKIKTIHVAGTNGKGSVSHILAATLQVQGYKTGLYTSPHLKDYRERIRINGEVVEEEFVVGFVEDIKPHIERIKPSFFEITVAMAFSYFAEQKVDIAVIETGLGGRLDSTNIITPILSAITNIGLDHTDMLGDTVEQIAFEKAGIIKENIPVVVGEANEKVDTVFETISKERNAPYIRAWKRPMTMEYNETDLKGSYQYKNINHSRIIIEELNNVGILVDINNWRNALRQVKKLTGLRGRWEVLQDAKPKIICDTGHNKDGLELVASSLKKEQYKQLHFVLGIVKEKDIKLLNILPKEANYYFCKPAVIRGLPSNELMEKASTIGLKGIDCGTVVDAFNKAKENAKEIDLIFVGGSTFTVAEVL